MGRRTTGLTWGSALSALGLLSACAGKPPTAPKPGAAKPVASTVPSVEPQPEAPKFPTLPPGPNTQLVIGDFVERVPAPGDTWLAHAGRPLLLLAPQDTEQKRLEIWDLTQGARVMALSRGNRSPAWDANGSRIAIGCLPTRVYETTTGRLLGSFESPRPPPPKPKPRPKPRRSAGRSKGGGGGTGYGLGGLGTGRGYGGGGGGAIGSIGGLAYRPLKPQRSVSLDACSAFVGTSRLLTIDARGSHVWDLKSGKRVATAKSPSVPQYSIAADAQGKTIAMLNKGQLELYDARSLKKLREAKLSADAVALSPDAKQVALGSEKQVKLLSADKLEVQHEVTLPESADERPVAYSSDGMTLFTLGGGQLLRVDAASGSLEPARKLAFESPVKALGTLPEKGLIVSASGKLVQFWDAKDGAAKGSWRLDADVDDFVVPPGGESIVVLQGSQLSRLATSDLNRPKALEQIKLPRAAAKGQRLSVSADATLVGVPGVGIFSLPTLSRKADSIHDPEGFVDAFSVLSMSGGSALILPLGGGARTFAADFVTRDVQRVAASKLGWVLASADGSVRMWQRESGELLRSFGAHYVDLTEFVVSPNGRYLATASRDELRVWDLATGLALLAEERGGNLTSVAFTHDSARLLSAAEDRTLVVQRVPEPVDEPSPPQKAVKDADQACEREYARLEALREAKKSPAKGGGLYGSSAGILGALGSSQWSGGFGSGGIGLGGLGGYGGGKGHYENDQPLSPRKVRKVSWEGLALGESFRCGLTKGGLVLCSDGFGGGNGKDKQHWGPNDLAVLGVGGAKQLVAGERFACARVENGEVRCWGGDDRRDLSGELIRAESIKMPLPGKAKLLAAGPSHACAALEDGSVWCWGEGSGGQLGNAKHQNSDTPVAVCGLKDVEDMALTGNGTCAIVGNGEVSCWGRGVGAESSSVPIEVAGISRADSIAAGDDHVCALSKGRVQCWGEGKHGQLGSGKKEDSARPQAVDLRRLSKAKAVKAIYAGGDRSCARFADGRLACWGDGEKGQLGDGSGKSSAQPVLVSGLSGVTQVATQGDRTCAVADGTLSCWGLIARKWVWDEEPKPLMGLGLSGGYGGGGYKPPAPPKVSEIWGNSLLPPPAPTRQPLFDGASSFFTTFSGVCALVPVPGAVSSGIGGEVRCQGYDTDFETLFSGSLQHRGAEPKTFKTGDASSSGKCLVEASGHVTCEVGYPIKWRRVPGVEHAVSVAVGYQESCAALEDGRVACWDRIHDEKDSHKVTVVQGISGATQVAAGGDHELCALTQQQEVVCWGALELDDDERKPAAPSTWVTDAVDLVAADNEVCAVLSGGKVQCRVARYAESFDPAPESLTGVKTLSLSSQHGCALLQSGEVSCWGSNAEGELGRGRLSRSFGAVVKGLPKISKIIATRGATCAVDQSGQAWCWGSLGE
ncbi:MAG: hypothetical protein H6718_04645 [Polyangiaceae bacterium]|nr:hypothetical protein [Polyangiaceae bacterium]